MTFLKIIFLAGFAIIRKGKKKGCFMRCSRCNEHKEQGKRSTVFSFDGLSSSEIFICTDCEEWSRREIQSKWGYEKTGNNGGCSSVWPIPTTFIFKGDGYRRYTLKRGLMLDMCKFVAYNAPPRFESKAVWFGLDSSGEVLTHNDGEAPIFGITCPSYKMAEKMAEIFGERVKGCYF